MFFLIQTVTVNGLIGTEMKKRAEFSRFIREFGFFNFADFTIRSDKVFLGFIFVFPCKVQSNHQSLRWQGIQPYPMHRSKF